MIDASHRLKLVVTLYDIANILYLYIGGTLKSASIFCSALSLIALNASAAITFEGKTLVEKPETKCELLFKQMALVVMYCPAQSIPNSILSDLSKIQQATGWPGGMYDIYIDRKHVPQTYSAWERLPEHDPFVKYTIGMKGSDVSEKHCFKSGREIDCKF